jgi:hypothetical protein
LVFHSVRKHASAECESNPAKKSRTQAPPVEDEDDITVRCTTEFKLPIQTVHLSLEIAARVESAKLSRATPALGVVGKGRGVSAVLAEIAGACRGSDRLLCYQLARYVNASRARFEPLLTGELQRFDEFVAALERADVTTIGGHSELVLQAFADRHCVNIQLLSPANGWQGKALISCSATAANDVTVYIAALEAGFAAVKAL